MKHITLITDAWPPNTSGVVTWINKTVEILEQRGHTVHVLHPGMFTSVPLPTYQEVRLALFPYIPIRKFLLKQKTDAVHIVTEGPLGLAARRICIQYNIPFTSAYHSHLPLYLEKRFGRIAYYLTYAYLRWFHRKSTRVLVSTPHLKQELENHRFKNVVVAPLGVDIALFQKNPETHVTPPQKPIFVYAGRLAVEKTVERFLDCALPGTKIVIGDGPVRKKLEKTYTRDTLFLGEKTQKEIVDWLSVSDVFVFPSTTDTFGLVILEALACEVPVAAYPVMGPLDIVTNGVDGVLDIDLEKAALEALSIDRKNCREKALTFSWEKGTDRFLEHLAQIPAR